MTATAPPTAGTYVPDLFAAAEATRGYAVDRYRDSRTRWTNQDSCAEAVESRLDYVGAICETTDLYAHAMGLKA